MHNKEIKGLIYKFEKLGMSNLSDGAILIGKALHIAKDAWINEIFPILNREEIFSLESN